MACSSPGNAYAVSVSPSSSLSRSPYCKPRACTPLVLRKESLKNKFEDLFDRERELAYFRKFVRRSGQFVLLTGPPDCGKTAILKQLFTEEDGVTWIDLRAGDFTTAEKFVEEVGAGLRESITLDSLKVDFNWGPSNISSAPKQTVQFQKELGAYLERRKAETGRVATLIIDEANVLLDWVHDEGNQMALASFLRFFVKITKQDCLANILLATSEYFMKFWLEQRIGGERFSKQSIGDFPESEARSFFNEQLKTTCSADVWERVYAMCGGRVLGLKQSAELVRIDGDDGLTMFLQEQYDQAHEDLELGLDPKQLNFKHVPAYWTADNFMHVMQELCKHPNGVMPWRDFKALPFCSEETAKALICYNMVHFRSRSQLAYDLSWYKGTWPVVMPISRAHFVAMQDLVAASK